MILPRVPAIKLAPVPATMLPREPTMLPREPDGAFQVRARCARRENPRESAAGRERGDMQITQKRNTRATTEHVFIAID